MLGPEFAIKHDVPTFRFIFKRRRCSSSNHYNNNNHSKNKFHLYPISNASSIYKDIYLYPPYNRWLIIHSNTPTTTTTNTKTNTHTKY